MLEDDHAAGERHSDLREWFQLQWYDLCAHDDLCGDGQLFVSERVYVIRIDLHEDDHAGCDWDACLP